MKRSSVSDIPSGWKLPEEIIQRLGTRAGRQRVIAESDHVLLILHKPPEKDEKHRKSALFWRSPDGKWTSNEKGNELGALGQFLKRYAKLEDDLEEEYDEAQASIDYFELLERLAPIQRSVKNMCNTLQVAREVVGGEMIDFRDRAEELNRSFELLYTDCKNGLDYAIARKTEEQSELQRKALLAGHRLNMIMALFLPITAAASLLGMNVPHGLEEAPLWVYFTIVFVCSILGIIFKHIVTREKKDPDKPTLL